MKVLMLPQLKHFRKEESGIRRVVEAWHKYGPQFDIEYVEDGLTFDIKVSHAGTNTEGVDVAILHGLYWTADLPCNKWEWKANANVIEAARQARIITVPSEWVAETIRRDMRRNPVVIGHGIDWEDWQHDRPMVGYVLWNKNRGGLDVCNPEPVGVLASAFPSTRFVTTFGPHRGRSNIQVTGVVPHDQMKQLVQGAGVYLSSAKETFGIGTLEAMASGVPVLGYAHGGNIELVQHGINGYLAEPGNEDDLVEGLAYCLQHRDVLGANGREIARAFTWERVMEKVAGVYRMAMEEQPPTVAIIVPSYMYADKVGRAIESAVQQTYNLVKDIVVVDDGSPDDGATKAVVEEWSQKDARVVYLPQENQGVAVARNTGIASVNTKYICCLDADDAIEPAFIEKCVRALERDPSLGLVYTKIRHVLSNGKTGTSPWPGKWDFDRQIARANQVPTCNVFRREVWECLGGYKKRYCPIGAGSEDAEFWTRIGAYGWKCKLATTEPLFIYSLGLGRVSGAKDYNEPDWLAWHPWAHDGQHPFASYATPKNWSHPVRQYDEPQVSVVIPVGPGHEETLEDALDSLEAQAFRKWECIVVWDADDMAAIKRYEQSYPYVRYVYNYGEKGAGAARNLGAEMARAPFLLFLDADDWLYPEAIQEMMNAWVTENSVIYSDYVGKAFIENTRELSKKLKDNILWRNPDGLTAMYYEALDYDAEKAQRQPDTEPGKVYTWNLITSLVPKAWHDEIGGFDEDMPSWEDVDYWWRIAKRGHCFHRIPRSLVVYHFYTGGRRDFGLANHQELFQYLTDKHAEEEIVGCSGCGGKRTQTPRPTARVAQDSSAPSLALLDEQFEMVTYQHPNRGQHTVVGQALFRNRVNGVHMVRDRTGHGWRIHYGFRGGGDKFLAHVEDIRIAPHLFVPVPKQVAPPTVEKTPLPTPQPTVQEKADYTPPPPPPVTVADIVGPLDDDSSFDLQKLPGVTAGIATAMGGMTLEDIVDAGPGGLLEIKGVGKVRAKTIYNAALEMMSV